MNRKKWAAAAVLVLLAGALVFLFSQYIFVGLRFYPRNDQTLDLRGQEVPPEDYITLTERLPDTDILWDLPFQGRVLSRDTTELTLTSLSMEEAELLALCMPKLRTVNANDCQDYEALYQLKQQRPDMQVHYRVRLGSTNYPSTATWLTLEGIELEQIPHLAYLPQLKSILVTGGEREALEALRAYCQEAALDFQMQLGEQILAPDTRTLEIPGITDQQVGLLYLLPKLNYVHLPEPMADVQKLLALEASTNVRLTWEKTILGLTFTRDAEIIDLTEVVSLAPGQLPGAVTPYQKSLAYAVQHTKEEVRSAVKILENRPLPSRFSETAAIIAEAEAAMPYFPNAKSLTLYGCYLDNEAMAQFRQRHREDYKVAWTVDCGTIAPRTDATFFMPVKFHVYYLSNEDAFNLRYCEDLVAVDIGHMSVSDISFVEFMPNLQYLILAHTNVQSIEPLRSCKNLKFLEVDHTGVQDLSPLADCPSLEDLNIGKTWCPVEPLAQVTWLKNLWMIFRQNGARTLAPLLPNTHIVSAGTATVDSGWRDLPNYFAMRDELKMFYMSW